MSYISIQHDRKTWQLFAWEKRSLTQRVRKVYKPDYYFYAADPQGSFMSMTGLACRKVQCQSYSDMTSQVADCRLRHTQVFESDFSPLERCLTDNYSTQPAPKLNVGFLDIECDVTPEGGFCNVTNAYAPINALTMFETATKKYHTLAIKPQGWTEELPDDLKEVVLCKNEVELLSKFLDLLHPIDLISGWNSEFFDVPYIAKRIELVLGEHVLDRLGFEGSLSPKWGEKERFKGGKAEPVLQIGSRGHLDYLLLYKKFDLTRRQSYSLDNVSFEELGENKLDYQGTLWDLYNKDFFKFLRYNIHDVRLLTLLDKKRQYIELANQMVHEATTNFESVYGAVAVIDFSIINYCHNKLNLIVIDTPDHPESPPVEGAIVMTPNLGFFKWVGVTDINSLYPSTIRSLNLSPEKIVGQLLGLEADWLKVYAVRKDPTQDELVQLLIDGERQPIEILASELNAILNDSKYSISAYGTILNQADGQGVLPSVLTYWFTERKRLQAEKKRCAKEAKAETDPVKKALLIEQSEYFDMLQGVRKVALNSAYGATLNRFCRFGDPRLGASTTYSGRQITTTMIHTVTDYMNENSPRLKKTSVMTKDGLENSYTIDIGDGPGVVYGDTDSCLFTMRGLVDTDDDAVMLADAIGQQINDDFPEFMQAAFNCQPGYETLIKSNRELVCRSGVFQAKKKYMLSILDKEGSRIAIGSNDELKTMGSAIRLSSTPNAIREFLKEVVMPILHEVPQQEINKTIISFRRKLEDGILSPLELATVNSINGIEDAMILYTSFKKMPSAQNAKAGVAYNTMLNKLGLKEPPISSGDKCKIFYVEPNIHGFEVIAFPSETETLPAWFSNDFQINLKRMQDKLIDANLKLIFGPIGWEVPTFQTELVNSLLEF